jgi:hypothetical protein
MWKARLEAEQAEAPLLGPLALAWKRPGLPTHWVRVPERNPEAMNPDPLPGYVWLELPGKVLHAPAYHLEFQEPPH